MKNLKHSALWLSFLIALLCLCSCSTDNRDMSRMGVSRMTNEGCNYLVFKLAGDYGNSVILDPNNQPETCGKFR